MLFAKIDSNPKLFLLRIIGLPNCELLFQEKKNIPEYVRSFGEFGKVPMDE